MEFTNVAAVLIIVVVLLLVYGRFKRNHSYWKNRGVPQLKQHILFGNNGPLLSRRKGLVNFFGDLYSEGEPHRYIGIYSFQKPLLMLRDPELIKFVLTKDFTHFQDRGLRLHYPWEPLTDHLFSMEYARWKILRRKLTPTFSTAKIKLMFKFVKECSDDLRTVLEKRLSVATRPDDSEVETKDLMARYTTDVISSCAFGIVTNSLSNPLAKFRLMGARIFKQRFVHFLMITLTDTVPWLIVALKLKHFEKEVTDFFVKCIADVVDYREKNRVSRGDFLDLLLAMKREEENNSNERQQLKQTLQQQIDGDVEMTLAAITAQCFLFFAAGFETSSTTLSFCLLELAKNTNIQQKAQQEIDLVIGMEEELTYDMLNDMNYLEMVILETLRLYPPLYILTRKCTQDYVIPDTNVVIEKGIEIIIPLYGLHHDSRYYKQPEVFNPDNFTETAKNSRHDFTHIPFGEGPKICIGMRFGLMQIKLAIATILRTFNIAVSKKTNKSITFVPISFVTSSREDILLKFSKR